MKAPNEIKLALEICAADSCRGCPYEADYDCDNKNKDALAYIQQLESAQPKWISVKERLPTELGEVLICLYGKTTIAWYGGNGGFEIGSGAIFWAGDNTVTHWMPLPQPPKEEA